MPSVTEEEFAEYQHLKSLYTRESIQESLSSITRLEDDIDAPIKKCVMAFALLGCNPVWSCCGFDYEGQPLHKKHQIGRVYFILGDYSKSLQLFYALGLSGMQYRNNWLVRHSAEGMIDFHLDFSNVISDWRDSSCIHFSEQAVQVIAHLEAWLMSFSERFTDEVVLKDSNGLFRGAFENWQYPPKSDWTIRKEDLLNGS